MIVLAQYWLELKLQKLVVDEMVPSHLYSAQYFHVQAMQDAQSSYSVAVA